MLAGIIKLTVEALLFGSVGLVDTEEELCQPNFAACWLPPCVGTVQ